MTWNDQRCVEYAKDLDERPQWELWWVVSFLSILGTEFLGLEPRLRMPI